MTPDQSTFKYDPGWWECGGNSSKYTFMYDPERVGMWGDSSQSTFKYGPRWWECGCYCRIIHIQVTILDGGNVGVTPPQYTLKYDHGWWECENNSRTSHI